MVSVSMPFGELFIPTALLTYCATGAHMLTLPIRHVSDKIPKHMLSTAPRQDPSHNALPVRPVLQINDVPFAYQDLICFPRREDHDGLIHIRGTVPGCNDCGKPFFWLGIYCVLCGDFFIKDFGDPRFCALFPCCWDCLPELPWSHCPDHRSYYTFFPEARVWEPVGLNPKKYSLDELEAKGFNVFRFD